MSKLSTFIHEFVADLQAEIAGMHRTINAGGATTVDSVRGGLHRLDKKIVAFHATATSADHPAQTATVPGIREDSDAVFAELKALIEKGSSDMRAEIQALVASIQPLLDKVSNVQAEVSAQNQTIQGLNDKIAAGNTLSSDDVKALADATNRIQAATSTLAGLAQPVATAADAASTAAAAPPPATDAPPPAAPATPPAEPDAGTAGPSQANTSTPS